MGLRYISPMSHLPHGMIFDLCCFPLKSKCATEEAFSQSYFLKDLKKEKKKKSDSNTFAMTSDTHKCTLKVKANICITVIRFSPNHNKSHFTFISFNMAVAVAHTDQVSQSHLQCLQHLYHSLPLALAEKC